MWKRGTVLLGASGMELRIGECHTVKTLRADSQLFAGCLLVISFKSCAVQIQQCLTHLSAVDGLVLISHKGLRVLSAQVSALFAMHSVISQLTTC